MSDRNSASNSVSSSQSNSTTSGQKRKFNDVFPEESIAMMRARPSPLLSAAQAPAAAHPQATADAACDEDLTAGAFGPPSAPYMSRSSRAAGDLDSRLLRPHSPSTLSGSFSTQLRITGPSKRRVPAGPEARDYLSTVNEDTARLILAFLDAASLVRLYATARCRHASLLNRQFSKTFAAQDSGRSDGLVASGAEPRVLSFETPDDADVCMSAQRTGRPLASAVSPVVAPTLHSFAAPGERDDDSMRAREPFELRGSSPNSSRGTSLTQAPAPSVTASMASFRPTRLPPAAEASSGSQVLIDDDRSIFTLIMPSAKARVVQLLQLKWPRSKNTKAHTTGALYSWPPAAADLAKYQSVEGIAEAVKPISCVHPQASRYDKYPDMPLSAVPYKHREPTSWLEVLNDADHCRWLRQQVDHLHKTMLADNNAAGYPEKWAKMDAGLEPEHVIFDNMMKLKEKEDILARAFPYRSLYYMYTTGGDEWEMRMGWRKRLVEWLRNLSMHFTLPPPVLADAVALADRFAVQYAEKMGRTQLQLLYLTALSIAARVHRIPQDVITTIRSLAPDYDQRDYLAMESHMVQIMGTTADRKAAATAPAPAPAPEQPAIRKTTTGSGSSAPEDVAVADVSQTGPTRSTRPVTVVDATAAVKQPRLFLPRTPGGICSRYSPIAADSTMPDVQMVVMTTPFAFAGHIICFLSRAWGETIAHSVREALYLSMKYYDIQRYSAATIAVASVFLGLRAHKLWFTPTAAAWFDLVFQTLHIDVFCVRECAYMMSERGGPTSVLYKQETNARSELKRLFAKINASDSTGFATHANELSHIALLAIEDKKQSAISSSILDCWLSPAAVVAPGATPPLESRESVDDAMTDFEDGSVGSYVTEREPWMGLMGEDGEINIDGSDDPAVDSASAMQARRAARHKVWARQRHAKAQVPRALILGVPPSADGVLAGGTHGVSDATVADISGPKFSASTNPGSFQPQVFTAGTHSSADEGDHAPRAVSSATNSGGHGARAPVSRVAASPVVDDSSMGRGGAAVGAATEDTDMVGGVTVGRVSKGVVGRLHASVRSPDFLPGTQQTAFATYDSRDAPATMAPLAVGTPTFLEEAPGGTHAVKKSTGRQGLLPSLLTPTKPQSSALSSDGSATSHSSTRLPAVRPDATSGTASGTEEVLGLDGTGPASHTSSTSRGGGGTNSQLAKMLHKAGNWLNRKPK